jgi:hypothetical protein
LQSFFSFTSGPEEQFAPDLAALAGYRGEATKTVTSISTPEPRLIVFSQNLN